MNEKLGLFVGICAVASLFAFGLAIGSAWLLDAISLGVYSNNFIFCFFIYMAIYIATMMKVFERYIDV